MRPHVAGVGILLAAALLFSLLPSVVTGLPLRALLLSDAEFYMSLAATLYDPALLAVDEGFAYVRSAKPGLENHLHIGLMAFAARSGIDAYALSVAISVLSLMLYVVGLYFLFWRTLDRDRGVAFLAALLCVIPVHAAGITTLGFQALGFLPRDTASVVAVGLMIVYFDLIRTGSAKRLAALFLACGLLSNVYALVFGYLAEVLLLAEVIRARRIAPRHVFYGLAFLAGAAPVIVQSAVMMGGNAPLDRAVLDFRHPYMMLFPLSNAVLTGLRRELIYCVLLPLMWLAIRRYGRAEEKAAAAPWGSFTLAAFIATVVGIAVENATGIWAPHFPRTSIFFLIGAMALCALGMQAAARALPLADPRPAALAGFAAILLLQSNLPSIYRHLALLHATREQRAELLSIAQWLGRNSGVDERVLAPSVAEEDLALTVRAYARRPMYFAYKDGGIAVLDGRLARAWLERYREQQAVLEARNVDALLGFMERHAIRFALVKPAAFPIPESRAGLVKHRGKHYALLQRP